MFQRAEWSDPTLELFLRRTKQVVEELVQQDDAVLCPRYIILAGTRALMVPLTMPEEQWRSVLARLLSQYDVAAYTLVVQAVSSLDLTTASEGIEAVPADDRDEEVLLLTAQRGLPPLLEMATLRHTTQGRSLDEFRVLEPEPALLQDYLILQW